MKYYGTEQQREAKVSFNFIFCTYFLEFLQKKNPIIYTGTRIWEYKAKCFGALLVLAVFVDFIVVFLNPNTFKQS